MNDISPITYPKEYFAAMVIWSLKISNIKSISLEEAMLEYSDIYGSLTEEPWDHRFSSELWQVFLTAIKDISDQTIILEKLYALYLEQDHSVYAVKLQISSELKVLDDQVTCGPLALAYDEYNKQRNSVRIHYNPTRGEKSWLASDRFSELHEAFRKLLEYSSKHYDAAYFTSSTWLNNVPNFQRLFPASFVEQMKDIGGSSYLGVWGQFVQSDGTGNTARLEEFTTKLKEANTMEECINAIPFKVLEGVGSIQDFYNMYEI
jgi:hypothetical protein